MDLCRVLVNVATDTPSTAATDDFRCGGTHGVFGLYHVSLCKGKRGQDQISPLVVPLAPCQRPQRSHDSLRLWCFTVDLT